MIDNTMNFLAEDQEDEITYEDTYKIIIADDDEEIHRVTTNANFDGEVIKDKIEAGLKLRNSIRDGLNTEGCNPTHDSLTWNGERASFDEKASTVGILVTENEDVRSLRELITYGLKGLAAYYEHAVNLGKVDTEIVAFVEEALVATE